MKQLHCINIMRISIILFFIILILFFHVEIVEMIGQSVITRTADSEIYTDANGELITKTHSNSCECIKYDCGCCQYMELDAISLNGTLCANASYLEYDYGISITVTFNTFTIINETVSARNPPPICVGEDIVDSIELEICLHIYDIDISDRFHACFEILGKIMKLRLSKIKLGCINSNNLSSSFLEKKKYSVLLV